MNASGGITLFLDEIQKPFQQQVSSTNSWPSSASWERPESRPAPRQCQRTSHELKYLRGFERCSCEQIFLPVILDFFFNVGAVSQFCAVWQISPEESFMHVSCKPTQDIETKIPRNREYLWISLHLKISEFPPNDNVKLSYDMICWKPRPQEWNQCASIENSH